MKKFVPAVSVLFLLASLSIYSCKKNNNNTNTNNSGTYRVKSIGELNYTYNSDGRIATGDGAYSYTGDTVTVNYTNTSYLKFEDFLIHLNPFEYTEDLTKYVMSGGSVVGVWQNNKYYDSLSWFPCGYDSLNRLTSFVYNRYKWNSDSDIVYRSNGNDSVGYLYYRNYENPFSFKHTGKNYFGQNCSKHLLQRITNFRQKYQYDFSYQFDSLNRPIKVSTNGLITVDIAYE